METAIESCNPQSSPPGTPPAEPSQTRYRWIILALVWVLYVSHGIISRQMVLNVIIYNEYRTKVSGLF
jgi:hypothetical protein